MPTPASTKELLLLGASRGLGFALAEEYLKRGWHVVATERTADASKLHALIDTAAGRLEIETVDINHPENSTYCSSMPGSRTESIPKLADTVDAQAGKAGLQYLDYLGRRVPW